MSSVAHSLNRESAAFSCSKQRSDCVSVGRGCKSLCIVDLKEEEAQTAAAELKAEFGSRLVSHAQRSRAHPLFYSPLDYRGQRPARERQFEHHWCWL